MKKCFGRLHTLLYHIFSFSLKSGPRKSKLLESLHCLKEVIDHVWKITVQPPFYFIFLRKTILENIMCKHLLNNNILSLVYLFNICSIVSLIVLKVNIS